jgi:hypothetical protein
MLQLLATLLVPAALIQDTPWPTRGWTTARPEEVGVNPAPLRALHDRIAAGEFGSIDRLQNGEPRATRRPGLRLGIVS